MLKENKMKCPKCNAQMKEVKVKIQNANSFVTSYQCGKCGYFDFEEKSINKAINEIKEKESPLKIKQKIIKLSKNRVGMYFSKDIVESLNLKSGKEILVSVPNRKKVVLELAK